MTTLLTIMDALQVHAATAAVTAGGSSFKDVAVGFPAGRGRCVRIFWAGERDAVRLGGQETLNSDLIAQGITIRAMWPTPQSATKEARRLEGEMGVFASAFRTNVDGDFTLGGGSIALKLGPAQTSQQIISGTSYAVSEWEVLIDGDEFTFAP